MKRLVGLALLLLPLAFFVDHAHAADDEWRGSLETHRAERNEGLRSKTGWLTLTGLHWLEPGVNRFGSDRDSEIPLPDVAPAHAGTLTLQDGVVTLNAAEGVQIEVNGEPVRQAILKDDSQPERDMVGMLDRLSFYIVKRGERIGVRSRDTEHPALIAFEGLDFFPLTPDLRIDATFKPYDEPRERAISNVIGTKLMMQVPGLIEFEFEGKNYALEPFGEAGDPEFWILFKDGTSGRESYGFRYLVAELKDGRVDLDFNRAYNPPCAFTAYATCPLPPRQNRLEMRVEAGEKKYVGPH